MGVICSMLRKMRSVREVCQETSSLSELGRDCVISYLWETGGLDLTRVKTVSGGKVCVSLVERVCEWPWLSDYVPFLARSSIVLIKFFFLKVKCSYIARLPAVSTWNWYNRCVCLLATDREVILDLNLVFLSSVYRSDFVVINEKGRRLCCVRRRCG